MKKLGSAGACSPLEGVAKLLGRQKSGYFGPGPKSCCDDGTTHIPPTSGTSKWRDGYYSTAVVLLFGFRDPSGERKCYALRKCYAWKKINLNSILTFKHRILTTYNFNWHNSNFYHFSMNILVGLHQYIFRLLILVAVKSSAKLGDQHSKTCSKKGP